MALNGLERRLQQSRSFAAVRQDLRRDFVFRAFFPGALCVGERSLQLFDAPPQFRHFDAGAAVRSQASVSGCSDCRRLAALAACPPVPEAAPSDPA